MKSFEAVLNDVKPTIWMLQETKLKSNETISSVCLNNFQVYYLNRQTIQGGGVALGVHKDYESTLIDFLYYLFPILSHITENTVNYKQISRSPTKFIRITWSPS